MFFRDVLQEWWHCLRDSKFMSDDWWCSSTKSFPSHGLPSGDAPIPKSINESTGQHDLAHPRRLILYKRYFEVDFLIRKFNFVRFQCFFISRDKIMIEITVLCCCFFREIYNRTSHAYNRYLKNQISLSTSLTYSTICNRFCCNTDKRFVVKHLFDVVWRSP